MKTSELIAKYRKVGLKGLSEHELRRLANIAWKKEAFSLNGLCNYARETNEHFFIELISRYGITQDVVTVKWVLTYADPNKLVKKVKNETTDKYEPGTEKKKFFSLWFITDTAKRFHGAIKAAAQSSQPIKENKPELTEIEEAEKQAEKDAAKVEANKRRNEEKKKEELKKKRSEAARRAAETRKKNKETKMNEAA